MDRFPLFLHHMRVSNTDTHQKLIKYVPSTCVKCHFSKLKKHSIYFLDTFEMLPQYGSSKIRKRHEGGVKIKDHEIPKSNHFQYLGLIIHKGRLKRVLSIGLKQIK